MERKIVDYGLHNIVLVGQIMQHNHHEKDKSLPNRANKFFDMTCIHQSRQHYIKKYFSCGTITKWLLLLLLDVDFAVRKFDVWVLIRK